MQNAETSVPREMVGYLKKEESNTRMSEKNELLYGTGIADERKSWKINISLKKYLEFLRLDHNALEESHTTENLQYETEIQRALDKITPLSGSANPIFCLTVEIMNFLEHISTTSNLIPPQRLRKRSLLLERMALITESLKIYL